MEHDWPGNVRELKNAVESAAILAPGETLDGDGFEIPTSRPLIALPTMPENLPGELRFPATVSLAEAERRLILAQVERCATKREAAAALGIGLRTLFTRLREYGVQ
jgi:DNA-binding NtrC family response regulator